MEKRSVFLFLLLKFGILLAQGECVQDTLALLENKIWRAWPVKGERFSSEMEFRSAVWTAACLCDGQMKTSETSYRICGDTIKTYGCKQYKILELTDTTLVILRLPERPAAGIGAVKYVNTAVSPAGMRENENRLDSIWRKEDIWNKGLALVPGGPVQDTAGIEPPRWAKWENLEDYFIARMTYPSRLLERNFPGYSVVMFSLDTLGLPHGINILATVHKDFDKEVARLVRELPHCLPCRDRNGRRMECFYTVYVPFLPQHYRDRIKADSVAEEQEKQMFVEWEAVSCFRKGNPHAVTDYINERLRYNPEQLGDRKEAKGFYTITIDSYGEVAEAETFRSCGIPEWDVQVVKIIKGMPRWTPTVSYRGKGGYRDSRWTVPVVFKNKAGENGLCL